MSDPVGGMTNGSVRQVEDAPKAPAEMVKDVAIIFLVGVAIVIGLLFVVYLLMLIMDKYCCCIPGWMAAGESVEIDHGPVARKAGLWGLRRSERQAILEHIFVGKSYTPDMIREKHDEENPACIEKSATEKTSEMKDDDNPDGGKEDGDEEANLDDAVTTNEDVETGEANQEEQQVEEMNDIDEANHDVVCAICLSEYGAWKCWMLLHSCCCMIMRFLRSNTNSLSSQRMENW